MRQNLIHTFRQSSIISKNPGYFSKKLRYLTSSNHWYLIFLAELLHIFLQYVLYIKSLVHIRGHVRRFYGNCQTLNVYMLYNNFQLLLYKGGYAWLTLSISSLQWNSECTLVFINTHFSTKCYSFNCLFNIKTMQLILFILYQKITW